MINSWRNWFGFGRKKTLANPIAEDNVPCHVAIIMDGNGRWANRRGLPRIAGHRAGMKTVKQITMAANDIGVKCLTLYAFSTENWKRPKPEVDFLMRLPIEFLSVELEELIAKNVQVRMMGTLQQLPIDTGHAVREAIERTRHNTGLILNFALNYGSRNEILFGIKRLIEDVQQDKIILEDINEMTFSHYLESHDLPDPDLLIRTSGELRVSNFMLWQLAYSELWFTDVYWPSFSKEHFYQAIQEYQKRARRYGAIK